MAYWKILVVVLIVIFFISFLWGDPPSSHLTAWRWVARRYSLHFRRGGFTRGPQMRGRVEGREVCVQEHTEFDFEQIKSTTEFSAQILGKLPAGLTLRRETVLSSVGGWIGLDDIQIGNPEIDLNLRIGGISNSELRSYFSRDSVREGALRFFHMYPGARVFDGKVIVIIPQFITDPELLQKTLEHVLQAAKALSVSETPDSQPAPNQNRA